MNIRHQCLSCLREFKPLRLVAGQCLSCAARDSENARSLLNPWIASEELWREIPSWERNLSRTSDER